MAAEFSFHARKAGRRLKYSMKSFFPMNSLWAMCNPQQGISQVLLDHIFTMKSQRGWENTFVLLKPKGGVEDSQAVYRKISLVEKGG